MFGLTHTHLTADGASWESRLKLQYVLLETKKWHSCVLLVPYLGTLQYFNTPNLLVTEDQHTKYQLLELPPQVRPHTPLRDKGTTRITTLA